VLPRFYQPDHPQAQQRFPHHGPTHAQAFRQVEFPRQHIANGQFIRLDKGDDARLHSVHQA